MASGLAAESSGVLYFDVVTLRLPTSGECTDAEFQQLCQLNPNNDFERNADSSLVVMTPSGGGSSRRSGLTYGQLPNWAMKAGVGEALDASAGFVLPNGAIRSPDASWVSSAQWDSLSEEEQEVFLPLVPEFVAEIRSPSDRISDLREKMREYIEQGVKLGWLIDQPSKSVEVYRPGQPPQRFENVESLSADPELPGFVLDLKVIWARKSR